MAENEKPVIKIVFKMLKIIGLTVSWIFTASMIIGGLFAGAWTLLPDEASKPCYFGYYAHCSFTPFSTLILFAMAAVGFFLLIKLIRYHKRR
jgi:hypothetical protein